MLAEPVADWWWFWRNNDLDGFSAGYAAIIGSAAFNICLIPCVASLTYFYFNNKKSIKLNKMVIIQDSLFNLLSIITLGLIFYFGQITPINSLVLLIIYCIYIYSVFSYRKTKQVKSYKKLILTESTILNDLLNLRIFSLFGSRVNKYTSILVLLISLILIAFSCQLLTKCCHSLSSLFGVNLFYVSFFIAAIASSIPDTMLSFYDSKKGELDDAFSNAFGSNIFDICVGLGLPLFIYTLLNGDMFLNNDSNFSLELLINSLILLLILSLTIGILFYNGKFNKKRVVITLFLYMIFVFCLMML